MMRELLNRSFLGISTVHAGDLVSMPLRRASLTSKALKQDGALPGKGMGVCLPWVHVALSSHSRFRRGKCHRLLET